MKIGEDMDLRRHLEVVMSFGEIVLGKGLQTLNSTPGTNCPLLRQALFLFGSIALCKKHAWLPSSYCLCP